jgi:serine O-acetyltransferase
MNCEGHYDATVVARVVEDLCADNHGLEILARISRAGRQLPSQKLVVDAFLLLRSAIFPGYFETAELTEQNLRYRVGANLDLAARTLREQIRRGLCFECGRLGDTCESCRKRADHVLSEFLTTLPELRRLLALDVQAAYEGDPAAPSPEETVFCYPGIYAITAHRVAHELHRLKVPLIPRMITEHAHSVTGIDIHPGATIGERFFIDHGTGVVIGETCEIGSDVRVYQGVTLGAKKFELDREGNPVKGVPRHPLVGDNVVIYAGATILGRVTIGRDSVIGGNMWVVRDVPPGSKVTVRERPYEEEPAGRHAAEDGVAV